MNFVIKLKKGYLKIYTYFFTIKDKFFFMTKIRKQPRRSTKKINQILLNNPFTNQNYYQHFLPYQIYNTLSIFQKISINSLDEYVPEVPQDSFQNNIDFMKRALRQQENRINEIRQHQNIPSHNFQLSVNSNVQQTKKTANNTQAGLFPEEDGLFNFCDLQDSIMKKKKQHDEIMDYVDWGFLANRKQQHDFISQVAGDHSMLDNVNEDQSSKFQINMIL